jgi:AcrR family transcriptional regulator
VYGGKTPEERTQERRERLLESGLETFGTVGLAQSAIESLCSEARVATRHFYELFGSKEQLLLSVDEWVVSEATGAVIGAVGQSGADTEDRIRAGLRAYVKVFADDPRRARVHFFEVLAAAPDIAHHRRAAGTLLFETFAAEAARAMNDGRAPRRDLSLTSVALLGATLYVMSDWAAQPDRHSLEEVVDELTRLYVTSLETRF